MAWPVHAGKQGAQCRLRCPVCKQSIRPCNFLRHAKARHSEEDAKGLTYYYQSDDPPLFIEEVAK